MTREKERVEVSSVGGKMVPIWAHVLPFVVWLLFMLLQGEPAGWKYAMRGGVCLALFLCFRPWRWYQPLEVKHLPAAIATGVLVCLIWVFPESQWMAKWPALQEMYLQYGVMSSGQQVLSQVSPYAPEAAGWFFTLMRLAGSALVIALIEEFFWRGFLYRWLLERDFLKVNPGRFDLWIFLAVAMVFGLEHKRWLVGVVAGLAYGYLMIRTRNIWPACIAHVTTNFLLGIYVLLTGSYVFW